MAKHAFADESGTMSDQKIMTVALVVLDGARTAEKLHPKLVKAVFPTPKLRGVGALDRWCASQKLHFSELSNSQKLAMAAELSKTNVAAIIGYCLHSNESTNHAHRFLMYTELLKMTINKAVEMNDHLVVSVAKQGGWESYGSSLLQTLRLLPEDHSRSGNFRQCEFYLASPSKQGQQIADFYASASWNFLISGVDTGRSTPYERIRHQVVHFQKVTVVNNC